MRKDHSVFRANAPKTYERCEAERKHYCNNNGRKYFDSAGQDKVVRLLAAMLLRKGCLVEHGGLLPIVKKNHVLPRIRVGLVSGMDQVKHRGP